MDAVGRMFARIAVSIAVGFLGAFPLASSSGLLGTGLVSNDSQQGSLIVSSGIILFFLTLTLIGPMLRLVRQVVDALGRVEERPRSAVALTMLGLGTLCVISAMIIQLNASYGRAASVSMNVNGFNGGPRMVAQAPASFGLGILTIFTFLLGASLIGLGVWASLKPSTQAIIPEIKAAARELDEAVT